MEETTPETLEQDDYEVRIGAFNGPMDLLVYLVQKKEVPLEQISIAEIADQFLKWVGNFSKIDLSKAGDFLSMASRLMALKVQELLPAEERDPELVDAYNEDREQLLKEMLEYQRYKQVAGGLQEMEQENFGTYSRGRLEKTQSDDDTLADANIWQLFRAYQKSLKTKISETIHHIELDYVTIQDRQQAINNYLAANGRALFEDLLDNDSHPIVAAVTFMAMLEMIKTDEIVFRQSELFGPIWIYRKKNNTEFAEEMAHETVFFSKDPEVKTGLVEAIRNQAIARSKEQKGDIADVMREAVLWANNGRNVTEDDLIAMLEGREDLSDVQDNPFAEMAREEEGGSGAQEGAATAENIETSSAQVPSAEVPAASTSEEIPAVVSSLSEEDTADSFSLPETSDEGNTLSDEEFEAGHFEDDDEEYTPVVVTADEVDSEPEPVQSNCAPSADQQMSDEEFAEFMRKAQEFYNQNGSSDNGSADNSSAAQVESSAIKEDRFAENEPVVKKAEEKTEEKPEEKSSEGPIYAGNEMTDEEYIAFLTRSAKDFGKKD